jgi:hypothetical protein
MSWTGTGVCLLVLLSRFQCGGCVSVTHSHRHGPAKAYRLICRANPQSARGRLCAAYDRQPRSSGRTACSHRGRPAELVAHPAAWRGERDPQRIADDHQEQGGSRGQVHGHRASRLVTVAGIGSRPGSGAPSHPPHHVPVHRLTGHKDQRGENDCQWPHGKGDSRPSDQPCLPHSARIRPRRSLARKMVVNPGRDLAHFRVSDGCQFYWPAAADREILDLIAADLSNTSIARRKMLSEKIVRNMRPTSGRGARPR